MALVGGFFNKAHTQQGQRLYEEYSIIDVGSEQFHAVAVALLDSLLSTQRGIDDALKMILGRFYQYFPKYANNQQYVTVSEHMKTLLDNHRKSELVECMAFVLRDLTVDELYEYPLNYREVFYGINKDTAKSYFRHPETELPPSALKALAKILGIKITLSFTEPGKELPKREVYIGGDYSTLTKLKLIIHVQYNQYFPRVKHKADFAYVGKLPINIPKPKSVPEQEDTLANIIALIEEDNNRLLHSYDQWRKTILIMVDAGELNREQLMKLYITFYPVQSANTLSLPALEQSARKPVIVKGTLAEHENQTIELLASHLAGWISTKQIDPDRLFDQIESQLTPKVNSSITL